MPIFETDGAINLDITPKEFYKACKIAEQTAMCNIIMDDFNLIWNDNTLETPRPPRNYGQQVFIKALENLGKNWYSLNKVDEEIVVEISKKYETP